MKRIVSIVFFLIVACSVGLYAQGTTMSIGSVTAQTGQSVNVPITVTNFTNVGAISLTINYNPSVLLFTGVANAPAGVVFQAGASGGVLTIGWFDATTTSPINIASGKLVDLVFTKAAGTSQLTFNTASCEVATDAAPPEPITVTYQDGAVAAVSQTLTLGTVQASKGTTISVPITAGNAFKIGSVSLKISYDPDAVTFIDTANVAPGLGFTRNAAAGVLTLAWFDTDPLHKGVSVSAGKFLDLKFNYLGGSSFLTFQTAQCDIADSAGVSLAVSYANGKVVPVPAEAVSLTLDSTAYPAGASFNLPLNVRNFKSVGAISLKIRYNAAVLTFNGVANAVRTAFTTNAAGGILTIGWFSAGPVTPITLTGKLLDLKFTYNGGVSDLQFQDAQSEIADSTGNPIAGVLFNNGNVALFAQTPGWIAQNSRVTVDFYSAKAIGQYVAWAAGVGGTVVRTVNGGYTWSSVGGGAIGTADIYAMDAISADTAFVTTSPGATFIYRTTDGGTTWTQVFTQVGGFIDAIKMYDKNNGIAIGDPVGGKWVIIKTTDGGATWARIATEPAQIGTEAGCNNGMATFGTSNIWFTTAVGRLYRSTDAGATWATSTLPTAQFTPGIYFLDAKYGIANGGTGIARTVDGGATWSSVTVAGTGNYNTVWGSGVDFWVSKGANIYRSTNRGSSFGLTPEFTAPSTVVWMSGVAYGGSASLWAAGTGGRLSAGYFATLTGVGDNPKQTIPVAFELGQNYPNPFNPSTTIEYSLPQRASVTLRIYDMLGQEIRTLTTGIQEAGTFKTVWDGRNDLGNSVSTGLYLYRIEASPLDGGNAFASFKKMLLLK